MLYSHELKVRSLPSTHFWTSEMQFTIDLLTKRNCSKVWKYLVKSNRIKLPLSKVEIHNTIGSNERYQDPLRRILPQDSPFRA